MPFIEHPESGAKWHTCRRELRWSDFDQYQHVNNAAYLEFTQDARVEFVRDVLTDLDIPIPAFFVRYAAVDYLKPLSSSEMEVLVGSYITDIGTKSFTMRQMIRNAQHKHVATVETVMVGINHLTGKTHEWTEDDRRHIGTFLIPKDVDEDPTAARTGDSADT